MIGNPAVSVYTDDGRAIPELREMTPPRESRVTDASRLMFPWPMMIAIVGTAITVTGTQYLGNAGVRETQAAIASDVRDMRTRMEMQAQIDIARNESRQSEVKSQNEAINELKRLTQLLQLQYAALEKQIQQTKGQR